MGSMMRMVKNKKVWDKVFGEWHIGDKFQLIKKIPHIFDYGYIYEIEDIDYDKGLVWIKTDEGEHYNIPLQRLKNVRHKKDEESKVS